MLHWDVVVRAVSKGNHLWEFIRDLLLDPATNPSLIRWEDEENGVFRIVNSKRVSELWGAKKSNPGMNYEKLSRAMRSVSLRRAARCIVMSARCVCDVSI